MGAGGARVPPGTRQSVRCPLGPPRRWFRLVLRLDLSLRPHFQRAGAQAQALRSALDIEPLGAQRMGVGERGRLRPGLVVSVWLGPRLADAHARPD